MAETNSHAMIDAYDAAVAAGKLRADVSQRTAALALEQLFAQIHGTAPAPRARWFGLLKAAPRTPDGLYLWGDVGRGKSMLMDMFVSIIQKTKKTRRVHFHEFMLDVHKRLFAFRQHHEGDVMKRVIAELAGETQVLCLDEMQVSDVTDAMILTRLFTGLMDAGMVVLFTSNRQPRDLYQSGLQRDQFLKFVALVERRMPIIHVAGPSDYRLAQLKAIQRSYVYPCDGAADDFLLGSWEMLTHGQPSEPLRLEVQGRTLRVDKQVKGTAWLTFDELCVRPLGANDYLTLARCCHTLLLQGIPKLSIEERNEAKRFVTLIDALYDHRVKLIATAQTMPDEIYPAGDGSFEFHRTASRLHEMQAEDYLKLAHIG